MSFSSLLSSSFSDYDGDFTFLCLDSSVNFYFDDFFLGEVVFNAFPFLDSSYSSGRSLSNFFLFEKAI